MEQKPGIETRINETLNIAKSVKPVELPAFFTDKTVNKLRSSVKEESTFSYSSLLKIAAVIVLLLINGYTIKYILNGNQDNAVNTSVTVHDVVSDYQPADATEVTFENK